MSARTEHDRQPLEQCQHGVIHQAKACEDALRLAAFAESEPTLSTGLANSLRKLATYHSENAFCWARHGARAGGAA